MAEPPSAPTLKSEMSGAVSEMPSAEATRRNALDGWQVYESGARFLPHRAAPESLAAQVARLRLRGRT